MGAAAAAVMVAFRKLLPTHRVGCNLGAQYTELSRADCAVLLSKFTNFCVQCRQRPLLL